MIYICKGCDKGCKGFCSACDECGKCCNEACAPCCKVLDRPMGGYVLLTAIAGFLIFGCSVVGALDADVKDCDSPVMLLCFANVALAIMHVCFAVYVQSRLVTGMAKTGAAMTSSKDIMSQASHIMLYDVGFCVYVFVFFGSFFLNCTGLSWISDCNPKTPLPWIGCVLMILFFLGIMFMAVLWWMILCCDDCCGSLFGPPKGAKPPRRKRGILGFLLGGLVPKQQPAPQQQQQQMYAPQQVGMPTAQGYVVQQPQPTPYGGAPPPAQYAGQAPASSPPPPQQPTAGQQAQQVAAAGGKAGLAMAGQGLAAAGQWMQKKGAKK